MAEHRPFPASPRRRALARKAGLHAASPLLVGAAAAGAALLATGALGASLAHRLGQAIATACSGQPALAAATPPAGALPAGAIPAAMLPAATPLAGAIPAAMPPTGAIPAAALPATVLTLALPLLAAAALAALAAHVAQTRALWLPRRRVQGAPTLDEGAIPRTRRTAGQLAAAALIGGVAFVWLWHATPVLAVLPTLAGAPATLLTACAAALVQLGTALAIAWGVLGVLAAVARHAAVGSALTMTSTEKREDDRLAGADPRWQARRAAVQRGPSPADAIAGASLLLLGDDAAVAIAWDPVRRPIPVRTMTGRGPRATQLLGLARRRQLAVHRDPALAAALVAGDGPIPEPHWPRLAEIVAAVRGRAHSTPPAL
ncbi:MAG TPA: EscU/YscU/HrcU family type III secretion system export apparatus switch protein [Kofleriaceae bacterium]|jgi:type III secretion system FlhB-like substrate exporter|nr:EscU/YscU/HrcU family type III secretion system export apparatus switch protein [Kofleriaceae bacterium]